MMYLLIGSLHIFLGQITNDSSTIDQVSVQMFDIRDRIGQQSFAGPEIRIIRISGKSTGYFYIPNYCTNSLGCIQHKFYRDNLYILDNSEIFAHYGLNPSRYITSMFGLKNVM